MTINKSYRADTTAFEFETYTWYGQTYTESGDYEYKTQTLAGCDSIVMLHLAILDKPILERTVKASICKGEKFDFYGDKLTESDTYSKTIQYAEYDSLITLSLYVYPTYNFDEYSTIFEGQKYEWNGSQYSEKGDYEYHGKTANGCDSTVTLHLSIAEKPVYPRQYNITLCEGETYNFLGEQITVGGEFSKTIEFAEYDSLILVNVTLNPTFETDTFAVACDEFTWHDMTYTESGDYQYFGRTVTECDSTVTLHLTINTSRRSDSIAVAYESYEWRGHTYTESGNYEFETHTTAGCDSIITLHLTVLHDTASSCTPYIISVSSNNPQRGQTDILQQPSCENGQIAVVSATPVSEEFKFTQWSDGSTENPRTLILSTNTSLSAYFAIRTFTVNAKSVDNAIGHVTGSGTYNYGTIVTVTAIPSMGYEFVRWSDGKTDNPRQITVTEDVDIQAYFQLPEYIITTTVNDTMLGYTTGSGKYQIFSTAILTAVPYGNNQFVRWNDGVKASERRVIVLKNEQYLAIFDKPQYYITVVANNNHMGTVEGSGYYYPDDTVVISAMPNQGYQFSKWSDGNTDNPRTIIVSQSETYVAIFINSTGLDDNEINGISIDGHTININAPDNQTMTLYSILGHTIYSGKVQPTFNIPQNGIYILRLGNQITKIVIE